MSFGFDPAKPAEPETALKAQALGNPIADSWTDAWGRHWNVVGPMRGPDGSQPIAPSA